MNEIMNTKQIGKKSLTVFFVIVILLSAVAETMICRGGPEWLYLVLMWVPAMAATACMFFAGRCFRIAEDKDNTRKQ